MQKSGTQNVSQHHYSSSLLSNEVKFVSFSHLLSLVASKKIKLFVSLAPCDIKLPKIFYLKSFVASHSQQTSGDAMNNGKQHSNDDTAAAKWGELFIVFFLFILARFEMRNLYDVLVMTSEEVANEREREIYLYGNVF
jgi:hypothetical protein